jgi:hypothetical protein
MSEPGATNKEGATIKGWHGVAIPYHATANDTDLAGYAGWSVSNEQSSTQVLFIASSGLCWPEITKNESFV